MRDTIKDRAYFESKYNRDVKVFIETITILERALILREQQGDAFKGKINLINYGIFLEFLRKLYSGYSLGLPRQEFEKDMPTVLSAMLNYWDGRVFDPIMMMMSFAIIFDISKEDMRPLLDLLIKHEYEDFVLDSMARYIDPDFEVRTEYVLVPSDTKAYAKAIRLAETDPQKAVAEIASFVDNKWLKLQDGIIDDTLHLTEDKYRGYWCIESAAIVKMLKLDDEALKNCKYYPYDMAHW